MYSETPIINDFLIVRPNEESIFPQAISISPNGFYQFAFNNAKDAAIYDITMRIHYREGTYVPATGDFVDMVSKEIDWKFVKNLSTISSGPGELITYDIQGPAFYNFLKNNFSLILILILLDWQIRLNLLWMQAVKVFINTFNTVVLLSA